MKAGNFYSALKLAYQGFGNRTGRRIQGIVLIGRKRIGVALLGNDWLGERIIGGKVSQFICDLKFNKDWIKFSE